MLQQIADTVLLNKRKVKDFKIIDIITSLYFINTSKMSFREVLISLKVKITLSTLC